jgi:hypothetical protein
MKKGINSLDAFFAIMLMLSISLLMQNFFNLNFQDSNEFGTQAGINMEAVEAGSVMNSFFAIDPSPYDYMILNGTIRGFDGDSDVSIQKSGALAEVSVIYGGVTYYSEYPVASQVKYNPSSQKVTR